MKILLTCSLSLLISVFCFGQNAIQLPEFQLDKSTYERHLMYLASDELGGRRTGSEGGELAANYIAELFESYGVKPVVGDTSYFQSLPFQEIFPPQQASLKVGGSTFTHGDNLLILKGGKSEGTAAAVFAGHGWVDEETGHNDYSDLDVKGKVVFVLPGPPNSENPFETFKAMTKKREMAKQHGAVGLIELFRMNFPWRFFKSNLDRERLELAEEEKEEDSDFFYGFIQEGKPNPIAELEKGAEMQVEFSNSGLTTNYLTAPNVIGLIEGKDELLKEEYIIVSAHYDHVGVGKQGGAPYTEADSIFNGARDNGMGTVALLAVAEALASAPPKRSVVLLACTAEEVGLVGSEYYIQHPIFPLEKTVFNLNNDGAGYNSTKHFTVIGLELTDVDSILYQAGKPFGLELTGDPAPSQGLYQRSDNINFAKAGIPAIDIAPGITEMNEEVFKYYHQAIDNPDGIDYDYLLNFCKTFAHMARNIADQEVKPTWVPNSTYQQD